MGFRFVRWLLMMFIFTFSSSHCHRGLIVIACDWFDDIEWVRMNGSCLLKDENALDNLFFSFFSFLQWWKQTRNEMKFRLHSFCFSFLRCLMIVSNSRKTKTIVIFLGLWFEKAWFWSNWSKWSKSQPHLQSMFWICFVFFLLFDLRIVEKEKCGKRFEIYLFATIGEIRERMNEKCDFSHLSNWMKLPRDWIGWMVEIVCNQSKQRFRQRQNSIFFFFFQRGRKMRFSLVLIPIFRFFSNDFF